MIDIKGIAECNVMQVNGDHLLLGSTLSLTQIEEANLFPLLTKTSSEVADHTARGKITLGGNIVHKFTTGKLFCHFYFLIAKFIIVAEGKKMVPINEIF